MSSRTLRRRLYHGDVDGKRQEHLETSGLDSLSEPLLADDDYIENKKICTLEDLWDDEKKKAQFHWTFIFSNLIVQWAQWLANLVLGSGSILGRLLSFPSAALNMQNNRMFPPSLSPLQEERLRNLRQRLEVPFDGVEIKKPAAAAHGHQQGPFTVEYYLKAALAGGICCSITHAALCPVDVVKTRIQLDPVTYNKGMIGGFRQVIAAEGVGALATGIGPTAVGYFVQGWFKFGGVEFFKTKFAAALGERKAWENRNNIYLASSAMAEFIADVFLCPLEATRIRMVSNPAFAKSLGEAAPKILREEGFIKGFYPGFGPILMKQVPYTMAKFAVQGYAAEEISNKVVGVPLEKQTGNTKLSVSLLSGVIAGVAAAIISHPADTLLSMVNKKGAGGDGGIMSRLFNCAKSVGIVKLCTTGLGARCVMIGTLTAGQFALFDKVMEVTGAQKFHFTDPDKPHH